VATFFCLLFVSTCVTINIYFPAEKVESVAGEIVSEIRSQEPVKEDESIEKQKDSQGEQDSQEKRDSKLEENTSSLKSLLFLLQRSAWADEVTTVSNPTIRALKASMKNRYAQMKPYYGKGILIEGSDGYVSQGNTAALGLKEKRDVGNLISAENKDREKLYQEVAKALNIDPSQTNKIAEIFGKEWQKSVRQ
jgi:hypothetical protein